MIVQVHPDRNLQSSRTILYAGYPVRSSFSLSLVNHHVSQSYIYNRREYRVRSGAPSFTLRMLRQSQCSIWMWVP